MECLFTLKVSSHTKTTFELDSQHTPSSSSQVSFGRYPKSASTRIDSHRHCGIRVPACVVCSCEVCASACVFSLRLLFAALLRSSSRLCGVVLHGFVASSRFFTDFLSTVRPILPLKPVVKAWSLGLLFGRQCCLLTAVLNVFGKFNRI